ncbi:MAG: ribonuclease M5 [Lactovum sp.]
MKKINQIVVVEGRDDSANLKRFYDVETYETMGSAINKEDLERLQRLQEKQGIIIFTDPDFQGERIRKIIMAAIPEAEHVFIQRSEAIPKKKGSLGIEHADFQALEKAFSKINQTKKSMSKEINKSDLVRLGLIMGEKSRQKREFLCKELRIGYVNGKQLSKRLKMFAIEKEEIEKVMNDYRN